MKAGRKPKCNAETIEKAVKLKKAGCNNKDIAAAIGIAEGTFYAWLNQPANKMHREFSESIKKAEADYKAALLSIIARDAQEKDWKAAAWLLERKYPAEYARTDRIQAEVNAQSENKVTISHVFDYGE